MTVNLACLEFSRSSVERFLAYEDLFRTIFQISAGTSLALAVTFIAAKIHAAIISLLTAGHFTTLIALIVSSTPFVWTVITLGGIAAIFEGIILLSEHLRRQILSQDNLI